MVGRVVAKYSSKVAEVLPEAEDGTATVQHVFVAYTDLLELAELPTYDQVVNDATIQTAPAIALPVSKVGLSSYSVAAVTGWMSNVGLSQYVSLFSEHLVDGALLEVLEDNDLKELGILLSIQRKKILSEINKLKSVS
jgi:hypothetical protein